jgi:hypothetical protein
MQTQHKKLQPHEKELFLRSCMVAECHPVSKNILNKKIGEAVVVQMRATELVYKRGVQTKNLLRPTPSFLLEERCAELINN